MGMLLARAVCDCHHKRCRYHHKTAPSSSDEYVQNLISCCTHSLQPSFPTGTVCDYSELTQEQFWVAMARRNYLWGHTPDGSPIDLKELSSQLPSTVEGNVSVVIKGSMCFIYAVMNWICLFDAGAQLTTVRRQKVNLLTGSWMWRPVAYMKCLVVFLGG